MRESKWYGLRIPEQDDEYNVDDFGAAFDKTDDALHRLSAALETESELVRIDHGLGTYPQVTLGALQYGLGVAGLDEGPLGGTNTAQYPAGGLSQQPVADRDDDKKHCTARYRTNAA